MFELLKGFCDCRLPIDQFPIGYEFDPDRTEFLNVGFRFVGLISLIDPPKASKATTALLSDLDLPKFPNLYSKLCFRSCTRRRGQMSSRRYKSSNGYRRSSRYILI